MRISCFLISIGILLLLTSEMIDRKYISLKEVTKLRLSMIHGAFEMAGTTTNMR